jgi:DNA-binding LacI/PurR family transcriptional regulator
MRGMAFPGGEPKPATIYDVARLSGVSPSTVSRAFARPGRVRFETAERIRAVAVELGYRSASMRRGLAEGARRHGTIALVISDITNPVYLEIIRGAEEEATRNNYTMLLANTRESGRREREALERCLDMVDGVVLTSSRMSDAAIRGVAKQKPTVVANRSVSGISSVVTDNARGARRALEHLGRLGHRDIAYIGGPEASWAHGVRWAALKEAALELSLRVHLVQPSAPTLQGGRAAAPAALATGSTAVFGYNDQLAIGFMLAAQAAGRRVPEDLSVVGFDNSSAASLVNPGLTSIAAPLHALGVASVRNVLAIAGGAESRQERATMLPTRLVERESTGPRRASRRS